MDVIASRRSSSPEIEEAPVERKPNFCRFHLRRLCPRIDAPNKCPDLHFDDGEDVDKNRSNNSVSDNDDEDDDDEDGRSKRRIKRPWQNEKRSSDYRHDERHDEDDDDNDDRRYRSTSRRSRSRSGSRNRTRKKSPSRDRSPGRTRSERLVNRKKSDDLFATIRIGQEETTTCVYFIRGLCKRGDKCKFSHDEPDVRTVLRRLLWLKCCKRYPENCDGNNCSYLHIKNEDSLYFKQTGLITERILSQAVRKALQLDIPLKDNRSVCKNKLDGDCSIKNCTFLHLTRENFIKSILSEVKKVFIDIYGASDCLFPSVEAQNAIIQALLKPSVVSVPPPPVLVQTVPILGPSIASQPLPTLNISVQQQEPSEEDIDQVMARKLQFANKKLAEENKKFIEYIQVLEKENLKILLALDPEQPATDLDEMRNRILETFEHINWKSNEKLLVKSMDYQHRKTSEVPHPPADKIQALSQYTCSKPGIPQVAPCIQTLSAIPIIPPEAHLVPKFNSALPVMPGSVPGLQQGTSFVPPLNIRPPAIPGPIPFNYMMSIPPPVVPNTPVTTPIPTNISETKPLFPSYAGVPNSLGFPGQENGNRNSSFIKNECNEDNYESNAMEIVDEGDEKIPIVENSTVQVDEVDKKIPIVAPDTVEVDADNECEKLYIGGLDKTISDGDIWEYFSSFGAIRELDVKRNKKGHCRGFAFVTFMSSEVTDCVVSQDVHSIQGESITVRFADPHVKRNSNGTTLV